MRVPGSVEEASGSRVAQATQGVGRELEQAGGMLATNALALQHIQNETDAKNADVDVMVAIGQETSKFDQLEGDAMAKALPEYQKKIKEIRQEALEKMTNGMARQMLDQSISRRVGFALVDAGHKTGTQMRRAEDEAAVSRAETAIATADPRSPTTYRAHLDTVIAEANNIADRKGMLPDARKDFIRKERSKFFLQTIPKFAVNDPEGAEKLFDSIKDDIDPKAREILQASVDRQITVKQTFFDAQKILSGFDAESEKPKFAEGIAQAKELGEKKYPNNPDAQRLLLTRVESGMNLASKIYQQRIVENFDTVYSFVKGAQPDDKITDIQGVIGPEAPDNVRNAFYALPKQKQQQLENFIAGKHQPIQETDTMRKRYRELLGMASEDKEAFMDVPILDENLTEKRKDELYKKQLAMGKEASPDSPNGKYIGWAKKIMDYYKVYPDKTVQSKQKQYLEFIGAMDVEINTWKEDHKTPPTQKDVEEMAKRVGQTVVTKPGKIFDSKERRFEIEVPLATAKQIADKFFEARKIMPTKEQIRYIYYTAQKFKEVPNDLRGQ